MMISLDCAMNVHHKCQTKVANLCGINQKLLAEALTQVGPVSVYFSVQIYCLKKVLKINVFNLFFYLQHFNCTVFGISGNYYKYGFTCTDRGLIP